LQERAELYRNALRSDGSSGNGTRLRRLQRGLKTLEQMLDSVRSGKPIDQADIPPPVALGKAGGTPGLPPPVSPEPPVQPPAPAQPPPAPDPSLDPSLDPCPDPGSVPALRARLQELQKEALLAKRRGDNATALGHFKAAKVSPGFPESPPDPLCFPRIPIFPPRSAPSWEWEWGGKGGSVGILPFFPPEPPRDVREALEQRMERYRAAAGQARASGDDRKARMHERILKQYQAALRAHSAGRAVDLSELPVPPGFPPIQGMETPSEPSITGMLEAALRLTEQQEQEEEEEEEEKEDTKVVQPSAPPPAPPPKQQPRNSQPAPKAAGKGTGGAGAQQQLEFLELRRRQLAQAALRAKRRNDLEGAKLLLRRAKGIEGLLGAARGGLPVDLAQVPEVPLDGAEFELGPARGVPMSPEVAKTFLALAGALKRQHQVGVRPQKMGCSSELELGIERGIGLPVPPGETGTPGRTGNGQGLAQVRPLPTCVPSVPPGVAPGDLDTFVRFEFPHPSVEEAQRDKTNVVKNTDCPEFRARFRLRLLRGHRGLRRLLSSRGIRLEVTQKGGLFRPERPLGSAQLRLEGLEGSCELREQLELLDGRRRTGGRLEVWVRIREPLGAQRQLEPRSERWLVLEPAAEATVTTLGVPAIPKSFPRSLPTLPSLNLLLFDRERLERKMVPLGRAGRPVPPELRQQHQDLLRRIQGLRARLQGGDPHFRTEYAEHLERHVRLYTEAARRLGTQGEREAAKEALYKRNLVESEVRTPQG
ncbi:C2D1A protein, partial [Prunella fulvescens]|nr:C2D1A protein [Prunella fulvescens]